MIDQPSRIQPTTKSAEMIREQQRVEAAKLANHSIEKVSEERNFEDTCDSGFDGIMLRREFKTLEELKARKAKVHQAEKEEEEGEAEVKVIAAEKTDETATKFQSKNFELSKKMLLLLRESIKQNDKYNDILRKVLSFYPDPTLASEALDFLYETSTGELQLEVLKAKETLNARFEREIRAGKNIKNEAAEFSKEGLGSPSGLRDLYRDITGKSRPAHQLFDELSSKFSFDQLTSAIKFLFHALGSDLKSKGPSIARAELLKLIDDTKILQAILGVYRFFRERMALIHTHFKQNSLVLPAVINFEVLSKIFVKLLQEKYISADKIHQLAPVLSLSEELVAQIIVFSQFRDAIRNTAPLLYRTDKHRQEMIDAILEALEEIEEKLQEEEEEEEEENEEEKNGGKR